MGAAQTAEVETAAIRGRSEGNQGVLGIVQIDDDVLGGIGVGLKIDVSGNGGGLLGKTRRRGKQEKEDPEGTGKPDHRNLQAG